MVMKNSHYSLGGEIIGEKSGGVRTDCLTHTLGSVTATADQTGNVMILPLFCVQGVRWTHCVDDAVQTTPTW